MPKPARAPSRPRPAPPTGVASSFSLGVLIGLAVATLERGRGPASADAAAASRPPPAGSPWRMSLSGWRRAVAGSVRAFGTDRIALAAAGVTFYSLLSLFPALSALVSLVGLVADPADMQRQVQSLSGLLPAGALSVISGELTELAARGHGALGLAFAVSLAISIWSANSGAKALIDSLNAAYEAKETRGFVALTLLSLAFTLGAMLAAAAVLGIVAATPMALGALGLAGLAGLAGWRWPLMLIAALLAFSTLYRWAPARPHARWRWITPGGAAAAAAWVAVSALFSWYVGHFGSYDRTYGSLGAIVGFLTWIWLSLQVLLYGAELNSAIEKEAARAGPVSAGRAGSGRRRWRTDGRTPGP